MGVRTPHFAGPSVVCSKAQLCWKTKQSESTAFAAPVSVESITNRGSSPQRTSNVESLSKLWRFHCIVVIVPPYDVYMMTSSNGNNLLTTLCEDRLILPQTTIYHYSDVIMDAIASQITSLTIVYSIDYSDVDQRKHQSSASLAFVRGIHRRPVNSPHKWPVTRKMFHLMT